MKHIDCRMKHPDKLTAHMVKAAQPKEKEYKLSDGRGLYLRIRPTGAKSWTFIYRMPGSRNMLELTLGSIEFITLKAARGKVTAFRRQVFDGVDPRIDYYSRKDK